MTTFTGFGINIFQARILQGALELYANHKIQVNRSYTPTKMLALANQITGHQYRRGQHRAAALALKEWVARNAPVAVRNGEITA